jgi:hypothetical protein
MSRRSVTAGLAIVAAVAVAVPAIAQDLQSPTPLAANVKKVGKDARKLSKKAIKRANKALKKARNARRLAGQGAPGAPGTPGAPGGPGPAGPQGPAGGGGAAPFFAQAPGAVATAVADQYVPLGGPEVTVNVPQAANGPAGTGFIQVAAQAVIGDDAGAVSLFQDTAPMQGQSQLCSDILPDDPGPPLFASPDGLGFGDAIWSTPGTLNGAFSCANSGAAGPVLFETTPGPHTYELRYAYCGCDVPGTEATFSERKLWVTPLG